MSALSRTLFAATVATAALGLFAAVPAVHAADDPAATVTVECKADGPHIIVTATSPGLYDLWIDGTRHPAEGNTIFDGTVQLDTGETWDFGPVVEGDRIVAVDAWYTDGTVFGAVRNNGPLTVDCDPVVTINSDCGSEGADISVLIVDGPDERFNIWIGGVLVANDVNPTPAGFTFQHYADGDWFVEVDWLDGETTVKQQLVSLDCESGGSGAGFPVNGSETTPLILTAAALMALGSGLLMLRRRPA